ncbi:site-specific DNA-methyltransferase, partial [Nocardioides sp.]|uniref:site-specific DNA-methyltransferase n=1 Tax=Nocardioides sp. TaxID=35761 RepID=UPI002623F119
MGDAAHESDGTTATEIGKGLFLHWEGRRNYRTKMPAPRVLEPVEDLSFGEPDGNRVIEGDNLQVMVSLRSQYRAKFDAAYLDPPYNTGRNDFRYSDRRFHDPDADSDDAFYVSSEDGGRHTKWLNFMGPRLFLVWELLADHGVCFVSISDAELFRLGMLMDEIFGERNRLGVIVWQGNVDGNPTRISTGHEYILCYAKRVESVPSVWTGTSEAKAWMLDRFAELRSNEPDASKLQVLWQKAIKDQIAAHSASVAEGGDPTVDLGDTLPKYKFVDAVGAYASNRDVHGSEKGQYFYDVPHPSNGKPCKRPPSGYRFPPERMAQLLDQERIIFGPDEHRQVQIKKYLAEVQPPLRGLLEINSARGLSTLKRLFPEGEQKFIHPKPVELISQLLDFATDNDALILDPFAGSGSTGHAVMRLNAGDGGTRRFVLVEEGTPEDRYCRTLTAPRLRAASEQESLPVAFSFEATGERIDRDAILQLEREAITNLIIQTDITGSGRGLGRVGGKYLIGRNLRGEGVALCWDGRHDSTVDRDVLREMFREAKALSLAKPLRV